MRRLRIIAAALGLGLVGVGPTAAAPLSAVPILVSPAAQPVERFAAAELSAYLAKIYPRNHFFVSTQEADAANLPSDRPAIRLGSVTSDAGLRARLGAASPSMPEGFAVAARDERGRSWGMIVGSDPAGTLAGVYALLERLGCGFYLSYETVPCREELFSPRGWQFSDAPLVSDRIVFNWHNFLSGCSAWNLADWKLWIAQSQKMRFNTIMVHAYANNPVFTFRFAGVDKPVGFLPSTIHGRDWGTEHFNDVRRLVGGGLFGGPVFGADAALVEGPPQIAAVQKLMQAVFADAVRRGMHVCFALDVDTTTAQPQEMIQRLPPAARFQVAVTGRSDTGGPKEAQVWLANPDTPDGYAFYRAQAEALMQLYPQIDRLALWIRNGGTAWLSVRPEQMPAAWQNEYQAELEKTPEARKLPGTAGRFAVAKVLTAFQRAMRDLGHDRVRIMVGSWRFDWLEVSDRFFPRGMAFLPLDYEVVHDRPELENAERVALLRRLNQHRPILPIVWAHHDDGHYIGRPYTPPANFATRLRDCGSPGFGIIHWTTRPLELYFKSLAQQVWQGSRDEPLETTCREMARRIFGPATAVAMGRYLHAWITTAPIFGRETSDWFIDRPVTAELAQQVAAASRQRVALMDGVDPIQMTERGHDDWIFYQEMEEFFVAFHGDEARLQRSLAAWNAGDADAARQALEGWRPEQVVEGYARAVRLRGPTRGELGVLLAMAGNWLPYVDNQRQALRLAPVRLAFGSTEHEPLAQGPGRLTFHVDPAGRLWRKLGPTETGAELFTAPMTPESRTPSPAPLTPVNQGITITKPIEITVGPMLSDMHPYGKRLPSARELSPGRYRLRLWLSGLTGEAVCELSARAQPRGAHATPASLVSGQRLSFAQHSAGAPPLEVTYPVELHQRAAIIVGLVPQKLSVALHALLLEPLP